MVQGRFRTNKNDLLKVIGLKRGTPILTIDLVATKEKIEAMPWVNVATVERKLPNLINITIEERKPIAIWQNKKKFMPIDNNGVAINAPVDGLAYLPLVVGKKAPENTASLLAMLQSEPELMSRIKAAIMVGERRWDIVLDDIEKGISVRLPENETDKAWTRLAKLEHNHGILKRKLTMIDLRLPDRLVVRVSGSPKEEHNLKLLGKGRDT